MTEITFKSVSNSYASIGYEEAKTLFSNLHKENRPVDQAHVNKIKKAMLTKALPPITVSTTTMHTIDGQHRTKAFIELIEEGQLPLTARLDVQLVQITPEDEFEAIVEANVNSKSWTLNNFIESYAKNNIHYRTLIEWAKANPICIDNKQAPRYRVAAALLKGKNCQSDLKRGEFTIEEKDIVLADIMKEEVATIQQTIGCEYTGSALESLIIAWANCRDTYSIKCWIKALKYFKTKRPNLHKLSNKKEWIEFFDVVSGYIRRKIEIDSI